MAEGFTFYKPGSGNVGSYKIPARPWITGSIITANEEHKIEFPNVTRFVNVSVPEASTTKVLRVHFAPTGSGNVISGRHYMYINGQDEGFSWEVRCKEIYVSCASGTLEYFVMADLTSIPVGDISSYTGSGITE